MTLAERVNKLPSVEVLLRICAITCLALMGAAMITSASRVRAPGAHLSWIRELNQLFFYSWLAFLLFYVQWRYVEKFVKRQLDRRLGLCQVFGCTSIVGVSGLDFFVADLANAPETAFRIFDEHALLLALAYGEILFLANIIVTFLSRENAAEPVDQTLKLPHMKSILKMVSAPADELMPNRWGWAGSADKVFWTGAAFWGLAAVLLTSAGIPLVDLGLTVNEQLYKIPAYLVWPVAILPYVVFGALYRSMEEMARKNLNVRMVWIEFVCTLLGTLSLVMTYLHSILSRVNRLADPVKLWDYFGAIAFLAIAIGIHFGNVSETRPKARPLT